MFYPKLRSIASAAADGLKRNRAEQGAPARSHRAARRPGSVEKADAFLAGAGLLELACRLSRAGANARAPHLEDASGSPPSECLTPVRQAVGGSKPRRTQRSQLAVGQ